MKLRIAVNPAAPLHVGTARTALLNWLLARRHDAHVTLRIDDAGHPNPGDLAQADLRWLGLDWDEAISQSARLPLYEAAIERLKAANRLYPCFESDEELNAKRDARQRRGEPTLYDRAMLKLTPDQRRRAEAGGKRPYWRFLLSGVPAVWGDMVGGRQEVKLSAVSDPVLVRADGTPLPALCAAVDDIDGAITHVVRGEDHAEGTGIQIDITAALAGGFRTPAIRFAHLPPLMDAKGARLQQRTAALSLRHLRNDGMEPATLAGTLARLGTRATFVPATPQEMAPSFDLTQIARTPPRFDPRRLLQLNRGALAALSFEDVQPRLPPGATPAFWHAVRGSLDLMREARGWWEVVSGTIVPPLVENEADLLQRAAAALPPEPWDAGTWDRWLATLHESTGRGGKALTTPLRLALTGEDQGPDLATLLPLIGHARAAERLRLASA